MGKQRRLKRSKDGPELPLDAGAAVVLIKKRLQDYHALLSAIQAVLAEDRSGIKAFCEDYGLDPIDKVKRADVLRHALKYVGEPGG